MSIIHDALKKVQHSLDRNYGRSSEPAAHHAAAPARANTPPPTRPAAAKATGPDQFSVKAILWFSGTLLICLGVILVLVLKMLDNKEAEIAQHSPLVDARLQQRSQQMATFQSQQSIASPAAAAPAPRPTSPPKPALAPQPVKTTTKAVAAPADSLAHELVLGGIMETGNERVALINDDVYAVGDTVDGKKITDITLKEVTLQDADGTQTILKVLNRR